MIFTVFNKEFFVNTYNHHRNSFVPKFDLKMTYLSHILDKTVDCERDIDWSFKVQRWNMYRSVIFNSAKRLTNFPSMYSVERYNIFEPFIVFEDPWYNSPYNILNVLLESPKKDAFFKSVEIKEWFKKRTESMHWPIITEYLLEYKIPYYGIIDLEKRSIWDPESAFNAQQIEFNSRDLLINQDVLTMLYTIYNTKYRFEQSIFGYDTIPFWLTNEYKEEQEIKKMLNKDKEKPIDIEQQEYYEQQYFDFFQTIVSYNSKFKRPRILVERNIHYGILDQNPVESTAHFNCLHASRLQKHIMTNESVMYKMILETYNTLCKFFMINQVLLNNLTDVLTREGILWPDQIYSLDKNNKPIFNATSITHKQ